MLITDFDYHLPPELIARYPLPKRSASRLLCVDNSDPFKHLIFQDVVDLINPGDLLVFNDTKVIPARLRGVKKTGGQVEVLIERIINKQTILAQVKASKALKMGDQLFFSNNITLDVIDRRNEFYELSYLRGNRPILEIIEELGEIPLPHYMHRMPEEKDKERYQTIWAKHKGSVAAPTAGLHFDDELLEKLSAKKIELAYLTLHIGAGTFKPVRVENITEHKMHAEYIEVSAELCAKITATKAKGKRIIAVGTTALRALETASLSGTISAYAGETDIFIYPGFSFNCVDVLITNLHLPRSSLLMLVCAFGGHQRIMSAYQQAIENNYRFFSYGDAMWVEQCIKNV